jgi:alkanesulfonate monooxygenase SsuD/methylene tetrahydromethanopterin reductase-like flavin-dependent oxidoreductase (luciferase family)
MDSGRRTMLTGVGLDARLGLSLGELRAVAQEAERLGFESLWTPAGGVPDAFHICAAWSYDTGLRTGISVVPAARMWTPWALATQAATLGLISGGRFVLGIGTGGAGPDFFRSVGLPDKPIAVMRDFALITRRLLAGETVNYEGTALSLHGASLNTPELPPVPVYIAALGPQMLRLAGETADGVLLNWATSKRIAESRAIVAEGAARAGRDPSELTVSMYIRVCIDDDVAAARHAFGLEALGYSMRRPGVPPTVSYRGLFGQMGFDGVLSELEDLRDRGTPLSELVNIAPDELFEAVGYYGPAEGAPAAYARLAQGLDETMVRIITVRKGPEPVVEAMKALTPAIIMEAGA